MQVVPVAISSKPTLLDAIGKPANEVEASHPPLVLLPPKYLPKQKKLQEGLKKLYSKLEDAADQQDGDKFDEAFQKFRKKFNVSHNFDNNKTAKLTSAFIRKLMSFIFVKEGDDLSIRVYPKLTIKFTLNSKEFSRDLLPEGADLVSVALKNKRFLKELLEASPTPLTYLDFLTLVKYVLDTPDSDLIVPASEILKGFEAAIETFFDRPDMKTALSNDHLHRLLQLLTKDPKLMLNTSTILCATLDSIGLGPLLLTGSLPLELLDTLQTSIDEESNSLSSCIETSSLLSIILHRQDDVPSKKAKAREILYTDKKRKSDEAGWLDVVAQEGGMNKHRRLWIKKPVLPGSDKALTHRFVATTKFQEAPTYSLDRMIL
jgi:Utp8 family